MGTDDPVAASSDVRIRQKAMGENGAYLENKGFGWLTEVQDNDDDFKKYYCKLARF